MGESWVRSLLYVYNVNLLLLVDYSGGEGKRVYGDSGCGIAQELS
jgi:hypothetical protein